MALLQKKPQFSLDIPLFQSANEGSILIVGLGNPGKKYTGTRHNIGFTCVDAFAKEHDFPAFKEKSSLKSSIATNTLASHQIIIAKPLTYMNLSGDAVQLIASFYKVDVSAVFVVYDDIDIPYGSIRTKQGGGAAGHNGVSSVIHACGEDFARIRVGIGPKKPEQIETSDFVLGSFSEKEALILPNITQEVVALITETIFSGGTITPETRNVII